MSSLNKCDVQFAYTTTFLLVFFTEQEIPHPEYLQKIQIFVYICTHVYTVYVKVPTSRFVSVSLLCLFLFWLSKVSHTMGISEFISRH